MRSESTESPAKSAAVSHIPQSCCALIRRECLEKTLLVEQYLFPLLQHHDIPGGVIAEFKKRWWKAALHGKKTRALRKLCRQYRIPITPNMTDQDLRAAILQAEEFSEGA